MQNRDMQTLKESYWQWYLVAKDSTHVYRKEFQIESDHKPLKNIQNKNFALAPQDYKRCC